MTTTTTTNPATLDEAVGAGIRALLEAGAHSVTARTIDEKCRADLGLYGVDVWRFTRDPDNNRAERRGKGYGDTIAAALDAAAAAYHADGKCVCELAPEVQP